LLKAGRLAEMKGAPRSPSQLAKQLGKRRSAEKQSLPAA
jgi:hypothetical protein